MLQMMTQQIKKIATFGIKENSSGFFRQEF